MSLRLFRRAALVLLGLVGLIFAVIGAVELISQGWASASGTVRSCTVQYSPTSTGTGTGARTRNRLTHMCDVTWDAGNGPRTSTIELGAADAVPGGTVALKINGGTAVVATPVWVGAAIAAFGVTLVTVAGVLVIRGRRTA